MKLDLSNSTREDMIKYLKKNGEKGLSNKRRNELVKLINNMNGGADSNIPEAYNMNDVWTNAAPVKLSGGKNKKDDRYTSRFQIVGGKKRSLKGGNAPDMAVPTQMSNSSQMPTMPPVLPAQNVPTVPATPTVPVTPTVPAMPVVPSMQSMKVPSVVSAEEMKGGRKRVNKQKKSKKLVGGGEESSGATFMAPQFFDPKEPLSSGKNEDMMSAYGKINAVSGSCRNLAPFPGATNEQTGGEVRRVGKNGVKLVKNTGKLVLNTGSNVVKGATRVVKNTGKFVLDTGSTVVKGTTRVVKNAKNLIVDTGKTVIEGTGAVVRGTGSVVKGTVNVVRRSGKAVTNKIKKLF